MEKQHQDLKFYTSNDLARLGCNDCKECFSCCIGMGNSVKLNSYDIFELQKNLGLSIEQLLADKIELSVEDGLILPAVQMTEEQERCVFLNGQGRCSIHDFRPGLCRLFPLGRDFKDGKLRYFLLENACEKPGRSKMKISKWLSVPELKKHEQYLTDWHYLVHTCKEISVHAESDSAQKMFNMAFLTQFYMTPYNLMQDFYSQFYDRYYKFGEKYSIKNGGEHNEKT